MVWFEVLEICGAPLGATFGSRLLQLSGATPLKEIERLALCVQLMKK